MKIIYNKIIPFRGFKAINLFGVLFVRGDEKPDGDLLNHEAIHSRQMRELLYAGFYIIYLLEWIGGLLSGKGPVEAYRSISFEKEAYAHESDATYLDHRKPFAQWR